MKRFVSILIVSLMILLISACGTSEDAKNGDEPNIAGKLESSDTKTEPKEEGVFEVPEQYVSSLEAAAHRCNEVNEYFLAAIIKVSSDFDKNEQEDKFSGPAMLSQEAMRLFGKDEDNNGVASTRDISDSVWALSRMSCNYVREVEKLTLSGPKSKAKNMSPYSTLAAIVLYGGDTSRINSKTATTENVKRFNYWYENISINGKKSPYDPSSWRK